MKQIHLPDKCPICGSPSIGGNTETTIIEDDIDEIFIIYTSPVIFYDCGAKMWVANKRKSTDQYRIILNECEVEDE